MSFSFIIEIFFSFVTSFLSSYPLELAHHPEKRISCMSWKEGQQVTRDLVTFLKWIVSVSRKPGFLLINVTADACIILYEFPSTLLDFVSPATTPWWHAQARKAQPNVVEKAQLSSLPDTTWHRAEEPRSPNSGFFLSLCDKTSVTYATELRGGHLPSLKALNISERGKCSIFKKQRLYARNDCRTEFYFADCK